MKANSKILKVLLDKADVKEEFNTNNAWGFGGAIGTSYKFTSLNLEIRTGRTCYRHAPTTSFVTVTHNGKRIIDEYKLTEGQLVTIYEIYTNNLTKIEKDGIQN